MTRKTTDERSPSAPTTRRGRGADTRYAIVGAAIARIARSGFEGLRVRDVAQDVGINNATLHHHYPTKNDLVAGVVERFVADFEAFQPDPLADEPQRRLERYLAGVRELMTTRPEMFLIMNELLLRAARDPAVAKVVAPSQQRWLNHLLDLLKDTPLAEPDRRRAAERCRDELLGGSLAWGAGRNLIEVSTAAEHTG